jgi:signal transduction histidine kinase
VNDIDRASLSDPMRVALANVGVLPLIVIGSLLIALIMALDEWWRDNNQECRRLATSLGILLGLRVIYLLLLGQAFVIPLRPALETISLILLLWAFTRPLFSIPERADRILTASLIAACLGTLATLAAWFGQQPVSSPMSSFDQGVMLIWHLTQVGLAGLGVWFVMARHSELRWALSLVYGSLGLGHAVALFGYPMAVDFGNAIAFPFVAVASYQMITKDLRSFGEELRSVSERSLSRTREQLFLLEVSQTVNAPLEMPTMLEVIANSSGLAFDADRVLLLLREEESTDQLAVAARYHPLMLDSAESDQSHLLLKDSQLLEHVLQRGDQFRLETPGGPTVSARDVDMLQHALSLEHLGPTIIQPLFLRGQAMGLVIAARIQGRPTFTDDEIRLLSALATLVSTALENTRLYRDLKRSNAALIRANQDLQMAYERLREVDQLKSSFIGVITHELRSPFVGLDLSLQLLRRYGLDNLADGQRDQFLQLERGVSQARGMVDSLVSFASLLSRQGPLQFEAIDFVELIRRVVSLLQPLVQSRDVQIHIDAGAPSIIAEANAERMAEAVQHLVHNAVKFGRVGGRADIRCWTDDNRLMFEVEDDGPGIPIAQQEVLWERFTQMADSLQRGVEGLGLGLPLVKLAVEAHGGEVAAQSVEGRGSVFGFWIPLKQSAGRGEVDTP